MAKRYTEIDWNKLSDAKTFIGNPNNYFEIELKEETDHGKEIRKA